MGKPAARLTDMHTCPMVTPGLPPIPHVGGPITGPCVPTVLVGMMPAAVVGDMCICVGPPDTIAMGSPTVFIGNKMAARMGDPTMHGGVIVVGCPTVLIGESGSGGAGGGGAVPSGFFADILDFLLGRPPPAIGGDEFLRSIADGVNPENSVKNCGNIVDAVIARLQGVDPKASVPDKQNGSFSAIEQSFNTSLSDGSGFKDAFAAVKEGGDGTIAIVKIDYAGDTAHVVVMTNHQGTVGIVEAQHWDSDNPKEIITSSERADERYNSDGDTTIAYGIVPKQSFPFDSGKLREPSEK